jgi:predicted Rossmann fold flavoprotein
MKNKNVLIIGAGASGLVAAITARRKGHHVTLLEKHEKVGRKILASGNGRCNITNVDLSLDNFHGSDVGFASYALEHFGFDMSRTFFEEMGLYLVEKKAGRCYPLSNQAASVANLLEAEALGLGVKIVMGANVISVQKHSKSFRIELENREHYQSDVLIIATGGKAAAKLSSDGDGYGFAKALHHTIVSPLPALVQLILDEKFLHKSSGVKVEGEASILVNGKVKRVIQDDILFTNYGISGSAILDISRVAGVALAKKERVSLSLNLLPTLEEVVLFEMIEKRLHHTPKRACSLLLVGFINHKLIPILLKKARIDATAHYDTLNNTDVKRLIQYLLRFEVEVKEIRAFDYAETTAGGVSTKEVDPKTMESKKVKNLYFTGELLDIDGDCGGYNLAWAWASGYIAGDSI